MQGAKKPEKPLLSVPGTIPVLPNTAGREVVPSCPRAGLAQPDWGVASLKCCQVSHEGSGQAELVEPLGEGEGRGGSAEACIFGLVFAGSLSHPQARACSKQAEETKAKAEW